MNDFISANRKNPYAGAQMKKKEQHLCEVYIKSQLRGIHITNPVRMRYLWIEPNRRRDRDNITSFGRKVIQDALVTTKVLKNDGWSEIIGYSDEFAVDAKQPRVEITIEEEYEG